MRPKFYSHPNDVAKDIQRLKSNLLPLLAVYQPSDSLKTVIAEKREQISRLEKHMQMMVAQRLVKTAPPIPED